ncbi:Major facilitator, sugar transporter-like [Dillenia turbinata]|uniref:Major facilitator, sugar transporter-like n=1 Tax=Dillenia turbinata TaxID=194707 RepID=A0AAN8Z049_9MAGN
MGDTDKSDVKVLWHELLKPSRALRRMLITGIRIQCSQQIIGIDATTYYSTEIFEVAGLKDDANLLAATVRVRVTTNAFILAQAAAIGAGVIGCNGRIAMSFLSVS